MKSLITWLALGLVLGGCGSAAEEIVERAAEANGGGDVEIELDDEGGEFVIESDGGTQTVNIGDGDLPEGLITPIPDGYEVVASSALEQADGRFVTAILVYPGGDIEQIAAHFDDYYEGLGGTTRQQTSFEGGTQYVWSNERGIGVAAIARDGEDAVEVTVTELSEG
ncbi:MAG: hypothetical protein OEQ47_07155 [Acidimicrobiia bacterium]|nr:hypothetical protein [Acidimicrobiia bacterium]